MLCLMESYNYSVLISKDSFTLHICTMYGVTFCCREWMNDWMNDWMNEWILEMKECEWMNQSMNGYMVQHIYTYFYVSKTYN